MAHQRNDVSGALCLRNVLRNEEEMRSVVGKGVAGEKIVLEGR
jgi:hypothetical protein